MLRTKQVGAWDVPRSACAMVAILKRGRKNGLGHPLPGHTVRARNAVCGVPNKGLTHASVLFDPTPDVRRAQGRRTDRERDRPTADRHLLQKPLAAVIVGVTPLPCFNRGASQPRPSSSRSAARTPAATAICALPRLQERDQARPAKLSSPPLRRRRLAEGFAVVVLALRLSFVLGDAVPAEPSLSVWPAQRPRGDIRRLSSM